MSTISSIARRVLSPGRRMAGRGRRAIRNAVYGRRLTAILRARPADASPRDAFGDASDGFWLWLNTEGRRRNDAVRRLLPGAPPDAVQIRFTGLAGDDALRQAFAAYRAFKAPGERRFGPLRQDATVVDFGCGWGRVSRFFLRDLRPGQLHGIDCLPEAIELCRANDRWSRYDLIATTPPAPLPDGSVDLIYAYSVFSHLSEAASLAWVTEFARLLRPGGTFVVTTRKRSHIERCARLRDRADLTGHDQGLADCFPDERQALKDYDTGRFCFSPTGGGGTLDSSFYGEACISKRYVEANWVGAFDLIDYSENVSDVDQNVIAMVRR